MSETGRILIEKLDIYAYHGFFSEEERLGQRFVLDLVLDADLRAAAASDRLADTVDYGRAVTIVAETFTARRYNLLEGAARGREDGLWRIACPATGGEILAATDAALAVGLQVAVAVRPEKIRIDRARPAGVANVISGEVWDIGYLGDWTTYVLKLPGGDTLKTSRANVSRHVAEPVTWEENVFASFAPDAAVLLTG